MRSILLICGILATSLALADELTGKAIRVADGDTFTLLVEGNEQVSIRLAEIDAPESGQTYGNKSKQALSDLVFGRHVEVKVQTTDRYGRTVGRPFVGVTDVCEEMIRVGAAWVYRDYVIDRTLFDVEAVAREAKRGIWALPNLRG